MSLSKADPAPWGPVPPAPPGRTWEALMAEALDLAREAAALGEVPVGALVVDERGAVVARAHNETERLRDPTAHAEVLALRRAAGALGNHRLLGCVLVVTLEPCLMCVGALREARIRGLVYGALDERAGAVASRLDGLDAVPGCRVWHMGGVAAPEAAALLRDFFEQRRPA